MTQAVNYTAVSGNRCGNDDLGESEERLALVAEAATEGLYDWNISGNSLYVSPRLHHMFGFRGGSFNSETWYDRVHPDEKEIYRLALVSLFRRQSDRLHVEYRMRNVAEEYIWVRDNAVAQRDGRGRAVRLVGAVADISERKRVEEALRESQTRYELAMQAVREGVYDWNIESDEVYYSDRVRASLGLTEGQLRTAQDWVDLIHRDDLPAYQAAMNAHLEGVSERFEHELRYRRGDGEWGWARQHGLALRDDNGRVYRMAGSTGDITEEKRLRDALETTRRQLLEAVEAISEGFVFFDADDRVVLCNNTYRQYFADAVGDDVADMVKPGAKFETFTAAAFDKGMFPDITQNMTDWQSFRAQRRRNPEGAIELRLSSGIWLQVNERKTEDGGVAAVYTDVTNMKSRERELADKTATLEQLSGRLAKYLSPQVYDSIFSGRQDVKVASQRKKLTVFFSDIEDFTETTESLESEELTSLLNHYLTEMSKIALAHGATIDKYVGDAMMMFFGDPESRGVRQDALACVRMAIAMQQRMAELQTEWLDQGLERPFRMRIGINTGYCTVGNFGSDERMDYTIIGNEVNLAARLQAHAAPAGILLAHETHALVKNEIKAEQQEAIRLKGLRDPVQVYKVAIPEAPIASVEELVRRRIRADLAQLDKAAALNVLAEVRTQVDQLIPARNGVAAGAKAFEATPPELFFKKGSEDHG